MLKPFGIFDNSIIFGVSHDIEDSEEFKLSSLVKIESFIEIFIELSIFKILNFFLFSEIEKESFAEIKVLKFVFFDLF